MPDIEMFMRMNKIKKSEVAYLLKVSEMTIRRWLKTFDAEHHEKIMDACLQIVGEQETSEMYLGAIPTIVLQAELERRLNNETV